jgi:hypothetical protein
MSTVSTSRPTVTSSTDHQRARHWLRPWYKWLLTALAFPLAGLIAHVVTGPVDAVSAAVLGGVLAGAVIGAVQWALLRRRGVSVGWIPATAAGLGVGLAAGAALVSYRTDISSLALMGSICGLAVGIAQGGMLGSFKRMLLWSAATAALWAVGWTVTTAGGIRVEEQFVVFGAYGAIASTFLQSIIVGWFIPAKAVTS